MRSARSSPARGQKAAMAGASTRAKGLQARSAPIVVGTVPLPPPWSDPASEPEAPESESPNSPAVQSSQARVAAYAHLRV